MVDTVEETMTARPGKNGAVTAVEVVNLRKEFVRTKKRKGRLR